VDLSTSVVSEDEAGAAVLAALAGAELSPARPKPDLDVSSALATAERSLRRRQDEETRRRHEMNDALVEARRISLRETHARKVAQIDRRIATLRERRSTGVVHLQEAQRANQDRLLRDADARLDEARNGRMDVELVAICRVEVGLP
jgi:hypothetical protein